MMDGQEVESSNDEMAGETDKREEQQEDWQKERRAWRTEMLWVIAMSVWVHPTRRQTVDMSSTLMMKLVAWLLIPDLYRNAPIVVEFDVGKSKSQMLFVWPAGTERTVNHTLADYRSKRIVECCLQQTHMSLLKLTNENTNITVYHRFLEDKLFKFKSLTTWRCRD